MPAAARAGTTSAWPGILEFSRIRNYLPNHPLYTTLGKLYAKIDGLEWGGTWKSFTDPPHLQLHQFGSISEARRSFET